MSKIIEIPALIDPHVHFRAPGFEYKEDYSTGSQSAYFGGIRTVLDMPNVSPATTTTEALSQKIEMAEGLPIEIGFQFGATNDNLEEIIANESRIKAIKVFFGSSTGNLLVNDLVYLEELMRRTKTIITVHAEDEETVQANMAKYAGNINPEIHSMIRSPEAASIAVRKIIELVRKTNHSVYFCHVSTKGELDLIREAKKEGLPVFAEATPHHLTFDISDYQRLGNLIKMNPPIREKSDREALWEAVVNGTIDTVGSDHAPHLLSEKELDYPEVPSGIPGTETLLPIMLNAVNEGKLTLERVIELTSTNPARIFGIENSGKNIEVDMDLEKKVVAKELYSKCGWSPYEGMILKGWPTEVKSS